MGRGAAETPSQKLEEQERDGNTCAVRGYLWPIPFHFGKPQTPIASRISRPLRLRAGRCKPALDGDHGTDVHLAGIRDAGVRFVFFFAPRSRTRHCWHSSKMECAVALSIFRLRLLD